MSTAIGRPATTASDDDAEAATAHAGVNPLRFEPSEADCRRVARFGTWGLLWCGLREAFRRRLLRVGNDTVTTLVIAVIAISIVCWAVALVVIAWKLHERGLL